ncbi:MAG: sulfite exporter TauE/SafE family protein [Alphaproteobacteria bacterium]|nr:sulfite exporter TauE/SafE family protein [Alphaproteobacteria bacterium]
MTLDPLTLLVAGAGVFGIAFMKGAFGGGFAILGIPLLSLVMDPVEAGGFLSPLFVAMDLVALRYWKPGTWFKPDLAMLLPALLAGIALGTWWLAAVDRGLVAVSMAVITIVFAVMWFRGGSQVVARPPALLPALLSGLGAGITTMLAHAGGPPLAMYLLRRGLPKAVYAGTTSLVFTVGNIVKVAPWLIVAQPGRTMLAAGLVCLPLVPLGVWAGWRLHERLDQRRLYQICYALLILTALKLLWDGLAGH